LEGTDLSGKSTQARRLSRALRRSGRAVAHTREPGGDPVAERVRRVLLDVRHRVAPLAELLLYEAARAQHAAHRLRPALARGAVVVCERYTMATEAYQGYGRRLPLPLIRRLNRVATAGLSPDLTLVLDLSEAALRRRSRGRKDRLEAEPAAFARRVREGYRRLCRRPRTARVDAARPEDAVAADIFRRVDALLRRKGA
jgi:dTMP kinase